MKERWRRNTQNGTSGLSIELGAHAQRAAVVHDMYSQVPSETLGDFIAVMSSMRLPARHRPLKVYRASSLARHMTRSVGDEVQESMRCNQWQKKTGNSWGISGGCRQGCRRQCGGERRLRMDTIRNTKTHERGELD